MIHVSSISLASLDSDFEYCTYDYEENLLKVSNQFLTVPKIIQPNNAIIKSKRIILNVGGFKHDCLIKTLQSIPNSRLSRIIEAKSKEAILELCDDFNDFNEFFFDRNSDIFEIILNFYRTGSLHLTKNICAVSIKNELDYWCIDESYFEPCCYPEYMARKDKSLRQIRKYRELKNTDKKVFKNCIPSVREKIWNLIENPHSSTSARVRTFELKFTQ